MVSYIYKAIMFPKANTDFNLDRHLLVFLQSTPFFAELSRHIAKVPTRAIPTAAVAYNPKDDEFTLFWNPEFFSKLSNSEICGVLTHEFYHLVFGHISVRRKTPPRTWNIATDCAINSIILQSAGKSRNESDEPGSRALPKGCLIPGEKLQLPEGGRELTESETAAFEHFSNLIESFPTMQASEFYFNKLIEDKKNNPDKYPQPGDGEGEGEGIPGADSIDDHSGWDDIDDEKREYIEGKVRSLVEKAQRHADGKSNGWGNIPAELQGEIRRSVSNVVNWRSVLKQFIGSMSRGERSTSIKRINRRYPYIHPGIKRAHTARLLIAIDQSGSVDDEQLGSFFSELGSLTKRTTVDILPFDCSADIKDMFEWKKGTHPKLERVRGGGTDFNAPTAIVNDVKNRGKWDGFLILTDGECGAPDSSRVKRGWVLSKGHELLFETSELKVYVDETKQMTGAWR